MQNESLLSNNVILDVLQRLYFSESKPAKITPLDLSVLTYLALRRSIDHEIRDSYNTIAKRVGSERQSIVRCLNRLESLGWISVSGKGEGRTKGISINYDAFPAAQPIRAKISDDARKLAKLYMRSLFRAGRKKFPKNWESRQHASAQHILTLCGGNFDLACEVVGTALTLPKFTKRASISLYHLRCCWNPLYLAYANAKQAYLARIESEQTKGEINVQCSPAA